MRPAPNLEAQIMLDLLAAILFLGLPAAWLAAWCLDPEAFQRGAKR